MAAARGTGQQTPVVVHVGPSAARSLELYQLSKDSSRQRRGRALVWIREAKVWDWKYDQVQYGIGSTNQARSGTGIDSILSIYARIAPR